MQNAGGRGAGGPVLGYEFATERTAREAAAALDRRFGPEDLKGLRLYRIRWNDEFLVEATFSGQVPEERLGDARALLGEAGTLVHPEDLEDYKRATRSGTGGLPDWVRRIFGG